MPNPYRIESLNLARLDNAEFFQLMTESREAIASFNKSTQKETAYATKLAEMDTLLAKLNTLLHKSQTSPLTKPLEEADEARDAAYATLSSLVRAYSRVKDAATKEAYQLLADLLKNYKKITTQSYEKETESINHLLAKLKEETYQAAATRLHLTAQVSTLSQAQKAFDKVYQARLTESEAQTPNKTRELRRDLQEVYDVLVDFTAIYTYLHPELVAYKKLHDRLNSLRKRYKSHQAKGKKVDSVAEPVGESNPTEA